MNIQEIKANAYLKSEEKEQISIDFILSVWVLSWTSW